MRTYNESAWTSSYLLGYSTTVIEQDPGTLEHWAQKVARVVYSGGIEFFVAWDALWLAAVAGGVPHLVAQQRIGEVFASARQGQEVAA